MSMVAVKSNKTGRYTYFKVGQGVSMSGTGASNLGVKEPLLAWNYTSMFLMAHQ
jgi:hypothetical protein